MKRVDLGPVDLAATRTSGGKIRLRLLLTVQQVESLLDAARNGDIDDDEDAERASQALPPSPSPAVQVEDCDGWDEFRAAFEADGEPIARASLTKPLFAALSLVERKLATRAAEGLIAWRSKQKKLQAKPAAQIFLREKEAWGAWAKNAPAEAKTSPPKLVIVDGSAAWHGLAVIKRMWQRPLPQSGAEVVSTAVPALESLSALTLDTDIWTTIFERTHLRQATAWRERLAKCGFQMPAPRSIETGRVHEVLGPERVLGWTVPTEWPPRMDGTVSSTGPPIPAMTQEDHDEIANLK